MKRSEINRLQKDAIDFFRKQNFYLPKWAIWSKDLWLKNFELTSEIFENKIKNRVKIIASFIDIVLIYLTYYLI